MKKIFVLVVPLVFLILAGATWAQFGTDTPDVTDSEEAIVKGSIVVKGEGIAPTDRPLLQGQKRILALRAAKIVAIREAAETLNGMSISGETTILNASARSESIRSTVQGIVRGAQVVKEAYNPISGLGVVFLAVPLTGANGVYARILPQVIPTMPFEDVPFSPPAGFLPSVGAFDGLIVDARGVPLKPALINRVLAENGKVVYDPTKVPRNILIERGAAEYTNDIDKAKDLLRARGSNNPLIVKAGRVVKGTDVVVSPGDAGIIFSSNQENNFLDTAKVVFVLR